MKQKTQQITIIMKKKKTKFRIIHLLLEIGFWIASSSSMALAQDTLSKAQKDFIIEQSFTVQEQKNSLLLKDSSIISLNVSFFIIFPLEFGKRKSELAFELPSVFFK